MKALLQALRLTAILGVLLVGVYSLLVWGFAQAVPGRGEGFRSNGQYENIGQQFNQDRYFQSRPSAVGYNASGSGGSNKGPSNPDYLREVQARIDTFLVHNPTIQKAQIPSDLVTASGSGLDPDISVAAARIQVPRIAKIRHLSPQRLYTLINRCTDPPFFGCFGITKVSVLQLNQTLDTFKQ
jgi:potassium-transporting ATPase KdpC subunit